MEKRVVIKDKNGWWFVKTLKPWHETSDIKQAMVFSYSEAERVLYLYGVDNDCEIYELES